MSQNNSLQIPIGGHVGVLRFSGEHLLRPRVLGAASFPAQRLPSGGARLQRRTKVVPASYALIVLLALAVGLQNAVAPRLGVPALTTTVLTVTLTGLAADSRLAGGMNPNVGRRLLAARMMYLGALVGAVLIFHVGAGGAVGLALMLLAANGLAAYRLSSSTAPSMLH